MTSGHRARLSVSVIVALACAVVSLPAASQQPTADPFVGTWILNLAKSKYTPGPPPKSATLVISRQGTTVTVTVDAVNAAGVASHWMYAAAPDGKDYPASGNPDVDAVVMKAIDARTVDVVQKKAGKPTLTVRRSVSADGKTLTVTSSGQNAAGLAVSTVAVYDRKS